MERFWEKVDKNGDCWEWTAQVDRDGYGQFWFNRESVRAHRHAHSLARGPIPDGMLICHHCDNPGCVRPSHLFMGTQGDNTRDSISKERWTDNRGELHPNSRLTEKDVLEIRRLATLGVKQSLLRRMWAISQPHTSDIVARRKWRHI